MVFTSVLVVGAGTTGLTLACALRSAGVGVRVLEAAGRAAGPLVDRLAGLGVAVECGRGVCEVLPDGEVVVVRAGAEVVRAGWVVGCDGRRSAVRAALTSDSAGIYRRGRVLLAGSAARGQSGLGAGDARNLGWKLAAVVLGRAGERLLESYPAERRSARRHYRHGPLAVQEGWGWWIAPCGGLGRVRAGDAVPDLACHRADGLPTRLHAELGGHWALLSAFADQSPALRPWLGESLLDLRWPHNERALIRPDGHLAWRGWDLDGARRWLSGALGRAQVAAPILGR